MVKLEGPQHLGLTRSVAQTLAGRCGVLVLLPPSLDELRAFSRAPTDLYTLLWQGSYPRIYDRGIPAHQWLADYAATYLQRDVRQMLNIGDLQAFSMFLKLCAGRTAQELNLTALGGDAGLSHNSARAWLSVLEASYIVHRLSDRLAETVSLPRNFVVYGGESSQQRTGASVLSWRDVQQILDDPG